MKLPYYEVAAFTANPFRGNPAGVCVLEAWLPDALMQSIAANNCLAETAFAVPRGNEFELRWFTPTTEIDLCGHATLATAFILATERGVKNFPLRFFSHSGILEVARDDERYVLDFPARPATKVEHISEALLRGLGATPTWVLKSRDYLAVFQHEQQVRELKPDFAQLREVDAFGVIATAPGVECDFVSRFFAPGVGVAEDPVTGSTHCTLIPYWAERLQRTKLAARQLSARGGELFCAMGGERVQIGGQAVLYSRGEIILPN